MTDLLQNLLWSPGDGFKIAMAAFDHTRPAVRHFVWLLWTLDCKAKNVSSPPTWSFFAKY